MIIIEIKKKDGEERKEYLARVTIAFLENWNDIENDAMNIKYDEAICDHYCLAEDIKAEYNFE